MIRCLQSLRALKTCPHDWQAALLIFRYLTVSLPSTRRTHERQASLLHPPCSFHALVIVVLTVASARRRIVGLREREEALKTEA